MQKELIKVENVGSDPIKTKWSPTRYEMLAPGESILMPWEAFVATFGNPETKDSATSRARTNEARRVMAYFGSSDPANWEAVRPHIKATSVDGHEIVPVVDDLYGDSVHRADTTQRDAKLLTEQVQRLENELKSLRSAQAKATGGKADVPEDKPAKVPTGKRGGDG